MVERLTTGLAVKNLRVRSLDVDSKEVTWELGDSHADALDYTFEVLRSESPSGPYETITPKFEERYIFIDRRVPIGDKFVLLHYKLRVTEKATGRVMEVGPAAQQAEPDLMAQNIRRLEMTYFTQIVGRQVWLFKRRTFGPRCRTCWDSTLQKRTVDRCLDCFGTGMLRGYHDPIEVWMQVDPASKVQQNNPQQIAQFVSTSARMSYYPNVSPGDVVVEAENRRWRVQSVTLTERLRAAVKQELVLRQIEEKDIEFKLPVKIERALRDVQPSPSRMFDNPTDLNTAIENRTSDVFDMFMTYAHEDE
jgi:hypothetical protein